MRVLVLVNLQGGMSAGDIKTCFTVIGAIEVNAGILHGCARITIQLETTVREHAAAIDREIIRASQTMDAGAIITGSAMEIRI